MNLEITRTGGLGGMCLKKVIDLDSLPREQADDLLHRLEKTTDAPPRPGRVDRFSFSASLLDNGSVVKTFKISDTIAASSLIADLNAVVLS